MLSFGGDQRAEATAKGGEREICGLGGRVVVLWWVLYSGEGFYVTSAGYMDLHTQI
jgi:hypothetical protein